VIEAFDIDQYLLLAFNHQLAGYKWFFYVITQLGSPLSLALLASVAFLLGKNKVKIFAAVLIVGLLFGIVVLDDAKDLVKRPRPEGASGTDFLIRDSYSFPSGHALAIFLAASVLGAYYGQKSYIVGYVMALAVSLSRLYLGVHYPSDVLAGAIIGITLGEMLIFAAYRLGLCGSIGLLSPVFKIVKAASIQYDTSALNGLWPLSAIGFLAITSSIILYYLDVAALAILVPAVATIFIVLYVALSKIPASSYILIAFVFVSIGFVSTLSTFYLSAYALSLLVVALTYAAIIALTHTKSKTIKLP
jgi:undecaprenyl-diphosphatase